MQVSNEMLYELIKDFKSDVNRRFDHLEKRMDRLENRIEIIEADIQEIKESRNKVAVAFTRAWALASFLIAITSSGLVLLVAAAV